MDKDAVVGQIEDTPGVNAFAAAPELGLGFSSNGTENKVGIVDLNSLTVKSKVETGKNPGALIYEPGSQEVYAFNKKSLSATVIDAKTGKVDVTIPLPGEPSSAVADPDAHRVYCTIKEKDEVIAINTKTQKVANTWPVAPARRPSGLAIDQANHYLFIGCRAELMVVMDISTGNVFAGLNTGRLPDVPAFDPGTMLIINSSMPRAPEGVTIASEIGPDKTRSFRNIQALQALSIPDYVGTMALDSKTHKIYLAAATFDYEPSHLMGSTSSGPRFVRQGTFRILVYGMDK